MTLEEQECWLKEAYEAWGSSGVDWSFKKAAVYVYASNDRATLEAMLKNNAIDVSVELIDEIAKVVSYEYREQEKRIRHFDNEFGLVMYAFIAFFLILGVGLYAAGELKQAEIKPELLQGEYANTSN